MTIETYADAIGADLIIHRHHNQENRYTAIFENCEIKETIFLSGRLGNGANPYDAVNDYVEKIRGKRIVLNATRENRREFVVPSDLIGITIP